MLFSKAGSMSVDADTVAAASRLTAISLAGTGAAAVYLFVSLCSKYIEERGRKRFLKAACNSDLPYLTNYIATHPETFDQVADPNGSNALMFAAWSGKVEVLRVLLHMGMDIEAVSAQGWHAVTYASRAGQLETLRSLLNWGANPNVHERTSHVTPLMFAAYVGSLECVDLLLERGANPLAKTSGGALAFTFAEENGHLGIAGMLRHKAMDAQAEEQAKKEQQEALVARLRAKQAQLRRKKEEMASAKRQELASKLEREQKKVYEASFEGQVEILSVGCYSSFDTLTAHEVIKILANNPCTPQGGTKKASTNEFYELHNRLLKRRMLNALTFSFPSTSDNDNSESESESEDGTSSGAGSGAYNHVQKVESGDDLGIPKTPRQSQSDLVLMEGKPTSKLHVILDLIERVLTVPRSGDMLHQLINVARAVYYRGSESLMESAARDRTGVVEDCCIHVLRSLGERARRYQKRLERGNIPELSGARRYLPYFLEVSPETLVPMIRLLDVLISRCREDEKWRFCLNDTLYLLEANLDTITILRYDVTPFANHFALLGDLLLYVIISMDSKQTYLENGATLWDHAAPVFFRFLHIIIPDTTIRVRFLAELWRHDDMDELRRIASKALIDESAISYLVCPGEDSLSPCGHAQPNLSATADRIRTIAGVELEGDSLHGPQQPANRQLQRRDSSLGRVRVRSKLGKRRMSSGVMMKRRSMATITLQRACRKFMLAGGVRARRKMSEDRLARAISDGNESPKHGSRSSQRDQLLALEKLLLGKNRVAMEDLKSWVSEHSFLTVHETEQAGMDVQFPHAAALGKVKLKALRNVPVKLSIWRYLKWQTNMTLSSSSQLDQPDREAFLRTLVARTVEDNDVPSAVILRGIEDDLLSRTLVNFRHDVWSFSLYDAPKPHAETLSSAILFCLHAKDMISRAVTLGKACSSTGLDVACELMGRCEVLAEWKRAAWILADVLVEAIRSPATALHENALQLLCRFAGCMMQAGPLPLADDSLGRLLGGAMFEGSKQLPLSETETRFLLVLSSDSQQHHVRFKSCRCTKERTCSKVCPSAISRFHLAMSHRPKVRMSIPPIPEDHRGLLERTVRTVAAALLKHTGNVKRVIGSGLREDGVGKDVELVWARSWSIARKIVTAQRQSRRHVCMDKSCRLPVVENNGEWRCENGHTFDTYDVADTLTYSDLAKRVVDRAQGLLGMDALVHDPRKLSIVINDGVRFIESAVDDGISKAQLATYLLQLDERARTRQWGTELFLSVFTILTKSQSSQELLLLALNSYCDALESMPRPPHAVGHHPVHTLAPSKISLSLRQSCFEILGVLLKQVPTMVTEIKMVLLKIIQSFAFDRHDRMFLERIDLISYLDREVTRSVSNSEHLWAAWSVFSKVAIQVFLLGSSERHECKGDNPTEIELDRTEQQIVSIIVDHLGEDLQHMDEVATYGVAEKSCFRWLSLLCAVTTECNSKALAESLDKELVLRLITSSSTRVQVLAVRSGRLLLKHRTRVEAMVHKLFYYAGSMALTVRDEGSKKAVALETCALLNNLGHENRKTWGATIIHEIRLSFDQFAEMKDVMEINLLFRFWTALGLLSQSTWPAVLRQGARVKYIDKRGGNGQARVEYGTLVSMWRERDNEQDKDENTYSVLLDAESPKIPRRFRSEHVFAVNPKNASEGFFFEELEHRDYMSMLDIVELYTLNFWKNIQDVDLQSGSIVWDEVQVQVITALHAWLTADATAALFISRERPRVWRYMVEACSTPAPHMSYDDGDLNSIEQQAHELVKDIHLLDVKIVYENGSGLFSAYGSHTSKVLEAFNLKLQDKRAENNQSRLTKASTLPLRRSRKYSLLGAPELQLGQRLAMARKESSRVHAQQNQQSCTLIGFQEQKTDERVSYMSALRLERSKIRARKARQMKATRYFRSLSVATPKGGPGQTKMSACQPDTPRGSDAVVSLTIPAEMPTVDTLSQDKRTRESRGMLKPLLERSQVGRLVRVRGMQVGNLEQLEIDRHVGYVRLHDMATGNSILEELDLDEIESLEEVLSDKYKHLLRRSRTSPGQGKLSLDAVPWENNDVVQILFIELHRLRIRAAILHARMAALITFNQLTTSKLDGFNIDIPYMMSESGDPGQIMGMTKLCLSSAPENSNDARGVWKVIKYLFRSNDGFTDLAMNEGVLLLSKTSKETLFYESPHPLCPIDEDIEQETVETSTNTLASMVEGIADNFRARRSNLQSGTSAKAKAAGSSLSTSATRRRLSGSHRLHLAGASSMLVEFDQRCSVLDTVTQVTLSYDPQDREVIKVLGEGSVDAWAPVVVSGDTCYIHWQVDTASIDTAFERIEKYDLDLATSAWGFALRVRCLESSLQTSEQKLLEEPFDWRIFSMFASSPERILERRDVGLELYRTIVDYLRTPNLPCKALICQALSQLVRAFMQRKSEKRMGISDERLWSKEIYNGLYKLHYDLIILFDDVLEEGSSCVSPYFEILLELMVASRQEWCIDTSNDTHSIIPLCCFVSMGRRQNSKVVVDCKTCGLVGNASICLACAASCHKGHEIANERSSQRPCGCSARGPERCKSLAPNADVWDTSVKGVERAWFDVVCRTADVVDRICGNDDSVASQTKPLPLQFMYSSYKICSDGHLLQRCLRSLEVCLRAESQEEWWTPECRRRWALDLDSGLDSVAEVAFGLLVLESSMLESAFSRWWRPRRKQWREMAYTNQATQLARAMLNFQNALLPSSCYTEWDSRLANWTETLEGITRCVDEKTCTYVLTGTFPKPQLFRKCRDCDNMEICEVCAITKHKGHELSDEIFVPGYCDEKTVLSTPDATEEKGSAFNRLAEKNFKWFKKNYWGKPSSTNPEEQGPDQRLEEAKVISALLNVPRELFAEEGSLENCLISEEVPRYHLLSPRWQGILLELFGVKEGLNVLVVGAGSDNGWVLGLISFLVHGGQSFSNGIIHGFDVSTSIAESMKANFRKLDAEYGVTFGDTQLFVGDLMGHIIATTNFKGKGAAQARYAQAKPILGLQPFYDRIYCNGVCSLQQLEALSTLLAPDGILLCPMVNDLGYGMFCQRNLYSLACESRTLAPLYGDNSAFLESIKEMRNISIESLDGPNKFILTSNEEKNARLRNLTLRAAESWSVSLWAKLAELVNRVPGRETNFLTMRDITPEAIENFPELQNVDLELLRCRFAVLKRINLSLSEVLPLINFKPRYAPTGLGRLFANPTAKKLILLSTKVDAWTKMLDNYYNRASSASMPAITVSRKLDNTGDDLEDTLFMQTFYQIQNFPTSTLRRRDQSFRVRFAGEAGNDVGGLYRDLFTEICTELRQGRPKLFFVPDNVRETRSKALLPRPSLASSLDDKMFEFCGALMGIAALQQGASLSMDISPFVWKVFVGEKLSPENGLAEVDETAYKMYSFVQGATDTAIEAVLEGTKFTALRSDAVDLPESMRLQELCPFGREKLVSANNAKEYVSLLAQFRLQECMPQIAAMLRGFGSIVPSRLLPMFTWQELENLICGVADVDVELLQANTKYVGGVLPSDPHIHFLWDVLINEFTPEDRTQFLRFVWGRERMAGVADEKNVFQIGPHVKSLNSEDPDDWLPVAHTCFFSLDLPKYSSREIMKRKIMFAMNNCNAIDADDDGESAANMALSFLN